MRTPALVVLLFLATSATALAPALRAPGDTIFVSVADDGAQGDAHSGWDRTAVSADGRFVAFMSAASTLVTGDTNGDNDIFVRDLVAGTTVRASVADDGLESDPEAPPPLFIGGATGPSISADGRFVAFESGASDLVANDTNDWPDVFVRDLVLGRTVRASLGPGGAEANERSHSATISPDGRYVAFLSQATNLDGGEDPNGNLLDVYLHDLATGVTERVSVDDAGAPLTLSVGIVNAWHPDVSRDGARVVFNANDPTAAPGAVGGFVTQTYVRDRVAGRTFLASVATTGAPANWVPHAPAMSDDGRHVLFFSSASNLVPGDDNEAPDFFVRDLDAGRTERVSVTSAGEDGGAEYNSNPQGAISADGRFVVFPSIATLDPRAGDYRTHLYVHDRVARTTEMMSVRTDGSAAAGSSQAYGAPAISGDGRIVAFMSESDDLVALDTNGAWDVFARHRGPATGIGALSSRVDGAHLVVEGWARVSGGTVAVTEDARDAGAFRALGAELVAAEAIERPELDDVLLVLHVDGIPSVESPLLWCCEARAFLAAVAAPLSPARVEYAFDLGDVEVVVARGADGRPVATLDGAPLAGSVGGAGDVVTVRVPRALLPESFALQGLARLGGAVLDATPMVPVVTTGARLTVEVEGASGPSVATEAPLVDGRFRVELPLADLPAGPHAVRATVCGPAGCGTAP